MSTQFHLPAQPDGAQEVNSVVAMIRARGKVAYFASGVPIFLHDEADRVGQRVAAAQIFSLGLARQDELSRALEVNRTTLYRQQRKLLAKGVLGMVDGARGPHGPHRFTAERRRHVEALLTKGLSLRQAATQVGVTEGTVRHALRRGELRCGGPGLTAAAVGPAIRSVQATQAPGGIAVARHAERALARIGQLTEAAPRFIAAEAVRFGGALLALPAVLMLGLLQAGDQTYGRLKKGFYGLRATLLILVFMALLRIRTPEQLQGHPPGELGVLLGLDRAPEVKTLRRKLWEVAARRQASAFSRHLAEEWVRTEADAVGLLYVDGHVRPYHGTAATLPEAFVTRRRLCLPATTDFWVNQGDGQPLFVVTAPANDGLLAMLRTTILPEIRRLVGSRRVTVVFDREGYSPAFFREVFNQQFDVLTYRRGSYPDWPKGEFEPVAGKVDGRSVRYVLAERMVEILPGFSMREIRRLCDSGHQTSILTTRHDLGREVLAYRMFERWRQENFFRYMRQQFALDALVTYTMEPADPERTVPNPERKTLRRQIRESRAELSTLQQSYGRQALRNPEAARRTMRGFKIAHADLGRQIHSRQTHIEALKAQLARLPERVPLHTLIDPAEIVRLAPETKHLADTIKMVAYRAETYLVRWLAPGYARTEDEGRALVREMLVGSADIVPEAHRLRVRLHSLATRRGNEALVILCETLNAIEMKYPGTDQTLVYEAPYVA